MVQKLFAVLLLCFGMNIAALATPVSLADFETGDLSEVSATTGNVDVRKTLTNSGTTMHAYSGEYFASIAPGIGRRNHIASLTLDLPGAHAGDLLSFAYFILPEINDDEFTVVLSGPDFTEYKTLSSAGALWTTVEWVLPDTESGPSMSAMLSRAGTSSGWSITFTADNSAPDRSFNGIDALRLTHLVSEPKSTGLMLMGCLAAVCTRRKKGGV